MSASIGPLYHWSPRGRIKTINRHGLMPGKRNYHGPVFHGTPEDMNEDNTDLGAGEFLQPGVCLSPSPALAWEYSHGAWKSRGTFDLWQVHLDSSDSVHILPQWGAQIVEVRVQNRIPKSRLVWVAERTVEH